MAGYDICTVLGREQISAATLASAVSFASVPTSSKTILALLQNTGTGAIRYTVDGTAPTATLGFRLVSGNDPTWIPFTPLSNVKFIQETSGGVLEVVYYTE